MQITAELDKQHLKKLQELEQTVVSLQRDLAGARGVGSFEVGFDVGEQIKRVWV